MSMLVLLLQPHEWRGWPGRLLQVSLQVLKLRHLTMNLTQAALTTTLSRLLTTEKAQLQRRLQQ